MVPGVESCPDHVVCDETAAGVHDRVAHSVDCDTARDRSALNLSHTRSALFVPLMATLLFGMLKWRKR